MPNTTPRYEALQAVADSGSDAEASDHDEPALNHSQPWLVQRQAAPSAHPLKRQASPTSLDRLPRDVLRGILLCLGKKSLACCMKASRRLREAVHSNRYLLEQIYTNRIPGAPGDCGWHEVGTPDTPFPDELSQWLSMSNSFRRPLPCQRVMIAPLVLGCSGVVQVAPLSGITTAVVIAAMWRALASRHPQNLVVYCHENRVSTTASSVKRILQDLPSADTRAGATAKNVVTVTKAMPTEPIGLRFNRGTLVLKSVNTSRPAYLCGAGGYIGQRLTHVNGLSVRSLSDVEKAVCKSATCVSLVFESLDVAGRTFWDDTNKTGGATIRGVPFSLSLLPYASPSSAPPLTDSHIVVTLRFAAYTQRSGERESPRRKARPRRGVTTLLSSCFRKFLGSGAYVSQQQGAGSGGGGGSVSAARGRKKEVVDVAVICRRSEQLGINFERGTLVLKSVNPEKRAHRHGVAQHTGSELTHVNGVPVSTLEEVKTLADPRATYVAVEQGDKALSDECMASIVGANATMLVTSQYQTSVDTQAEDEGDMCLGGRTAPVRLKLEASTDARHFCQVLRDVGGDDSEVRQQCFLEEQVSTVEDILSETLVGSVLVVCDVDSAARRVAQRLGGVALLSTPGRVQYSAANNWMGERLFVATRASVDLAPRVLLVVTFVSSQIDGEAAASGGGGETANPVDNHQTSSYYSPWHSRALLRAGGCARQLHLPGASLTFVQAAAEVAPLLERSYSMGKAGVTVIDAPAVVTSLSPLISQSAPGCNLPGRP